MPSLSSEKTADISRMRIRIWSVDGVWSPAGSVPMPGKWLPSSSRARCNVSRASRAFKTPIL
jgi:hypothetical protein